jgi:hypothetical protein
MDLWFVCAFGYAISSPSAIFATGLQWLASAIWTRTGKPDMQIARKILLPQSQGKVATFNQQWTSNIYIYMCVSIYIYVCIECVPIKIKYLYSSLCAPRTLSQVIFFYSSWHAPSSLSPGSGQLDLLDFLCSANQSVA